MLERMGTSRACQALTLTHPASRMDSMSTLAFDTHKAVKNLRETGFEEAQAEAVVATVGAAMNESVATKTDVAELKARGDVLRAELKADMKGLELRIYAAVAAGVGLVKTLDFLIG